MQPPTSIRSIARPVANPARRRRTGRRRPPLGSLALLALVGSAPAAQHGGSLERPCTRVEGPVSGVWTARSSPYCVVGDLSVEPGFGSGSLTIEAGVEVRVAPGATIRVTGRLVVEGTRPAPITFCRLDPALPWEGLDFESGTPGSSLSHAHVSGSKSHGIRLVDTALALTGCVFEDNRADRFDPDGGGLHAELGSGDLVLRGCRFTRNDTGNGGDGGGLYAELGSGDLVLENCSFEENTSASPFDPNAGGNGGGVFATLAAGRVLLDRCELVRNRASHTADAGWSRGGGLACRAADEVVLTDCLVAENEARGLNSFPKFGNWALGGGISVENASLTVRRCVVRSNRVLASYWIPTSSNGFPNAWGGGLYHTGSTAGLVVETSLFAGNIAWVTGIYGNVGGGGLYASGLSASVTNTTIGRNQNVRVDGYGTLNALPSSGLRVGTTTTGVITSSIVSRNTAAAALSDPSNFPPTLLTSSVLSGPAAGAQLTGSPTVSYSNVEGGFAGTGNLDVEPLFRGVGTSCGAMEILPASECVDAGDPAPALEDVAFPPSLGGPRNDMGPHGGPLAGGWARWARRKLRLAIVPRQTPCAPDLIVEVAGGYVQEPVEIWLEAIDGVPVTPQVVATETLCAAGRLDALLFLPGACEAGSWTLRARSTDGQGNPLESNAVEW